MKTAVVLFALFASLSAFAEGKVEVTSFVYDQQGSRLAELCGKVLEHGQPVVVRVTVDPKTSRPGLYRVITTGDGPFCTVVRTYTGTATAQLELPALSDAPVEATASLAEAR